MSRAAAVLKDDATAVVTAHAREVRAASEGRAGTPLTAVHDAVGFSLAAACAGARPRWRLWRKAPPPIAVPADAVNLLALNNGLCTAFAFTHAREQCASTSVVVVPVAVPAA